MSRTAVLLLAGLLAACGSQSPGNNPASGQGAAPPGPVATAAPPAVEAQAFSKSCQGIPLHEWTTPLPGLADRQVSASAIAARERILGPEAMNPDEVQLWWFGVSTFIASIGGHLVLLDAWEPMWGFNDYVPFGREELAELEPEAMLIGHGHFDHAGDAGYVAGRAGTLVVGSDEVCEIAKDDAAAEGNADNFDCLCIGTQDAPEPGITQALKLFADLPEITILKHLHSESDPEVATQSGPDDLGIPNVTPWLLSPQTDPAEIIKFNDSFNDPEGGSWAYHFRVGDFSLLWHNTAGAIGPDATHSAAPAIRAALDAFPGCVDVQAGGIIVFNRHATQFGDSVAYLANAHPRISLPLHHDAWFPGAGDSAAAYEADWRAVVNTLPNPPTLDYLKDPEDFMVMRRYAVDDPQWALPMPGSSCAAGVMP